MRLPLLAVAFLLGILALQNVRILPPIEWLWLLPAVLLAAWLSRRAWLQAGLVMLAGGLWALLAAHCYALQVLPESLAGKEIWVQGVISDIPRSEAHIQRFELVVERFAAASDWPPGKLRLSWYSAAQTVRAGERWRLLVKLKPPHGFMNPGGFDYEQWLYQQGIHATGYVRDAEDNQRLAAASPWSVDALRQRLVDDLLAQGSAFRGFWAALAVGHKAAIEPVHWELLIRTGTNHLMAISGLHIGLVAGLVFWLARRLVPAMLLRYLSADQLAALLALLCAALYAALAGFAIPTQRALVMLLVVLGAVLAKRPLRPVNGLAAALLLVLLLDPLAVLSAGFWFSFLAVAAIAWSLSGRLGRPGLLQQWGRLQWSIALMLLPLSLLLFQQTSLVAPLANLILVPWVSFLVVPPVLLSLLFIQLYPPLAGLLLQLADASLSLIWPLIRMLGDLPLASWQQASASPGLLLLAMLGVLVLLAPRGVPQRWLGAVLLLPALLASPERPASGAFSMSLLDVGQGLSVYVETRHHRLLFDTGARFSERFDLGERVIVPFLQSRGVRYLDTLLVSHGDNDHKGGARSILQQIHVGQLLGQDIDDLPHTNKQPCAAGQHWRWDGVDFRLLHPDGPYKARNNHACVLHISNAAHSLLIAADIEAEVEARLLHSRPEALAADVLIVPHHGSKTSSTPAWIDAVAPGFALVSAGYRNRFGHPAAPVVARYRQRQIRLLNTADSGAISLDFAARPAPLRPRAWRYQARRYWHYSPLR
jgi:competence protein ComEC